MEVGGLEEVEGVVFLWFTRGRWGGGGEEGEVLLEECGFGGVWGNGDGCAVLVGGGLGADGAVEADGAFGDAVQDEFLEADEGAGEDEEDVVGADVVGFWFGGAGGGVGAGGRAEGRTGAAHDAAGERAVGRVRG